VEEFAQIVFRKLGMDNYQDYIGFDPVYLRNTEVDILLGDASKIKRELGWQKKYSFEQLIDEMIESDMKLAKKELLIKGM
jgi:GDPmannose 4,6-dehydratase